MLFVDEDYIETKLQAFENQLLPWKDLWGYEPLFRPEIYYGQRIEEFLPHWKFASLESHEFLTHFQSLIKTNFPEWINLQNFSQLESVNIHDQSNFIPHQQKKISQKKWHEIQNILARLPEEQSTPFHFVDCAGGQGKLSHECLIKYPQATGTLIDFNPQLTSVAKDNLSAHGTRFKTITADLKEFTTSSLGADILLGLHPCGTLTDLILAQGTNINFLVIGCCYHLVSNPEYSWGSRPLGLTNEALTLAAKSEITFTQNGLNERLKVKSYRYALELGLKKFANLSGPLTLRSFPSTIYQQSYSHYLEFALRQRLAHFAICSNKDLQHSLESYQTSQEFQSIFKRLFLLGLLRHYFARPLEVYVAYLRLKKLAQRLQRPVQDLVTIFSSEISPRNILITNQLDTY
jgi:hypothetical protein